MELRGDSEAGEVVEEEEEDRELFIAKAMTGSE